MTLTWSKIWRKTDVVSKMTRIWWILTRPQKSLKNLLFDWFLFVQNICLTEKIQRSYLSWHWRVMQSLKKNWCIVWKMTWGIWQIFTRALRSVKIGTLMGSFCPKQKMHELKIYRGIMWNHTEEWWKIWRGIDFLFQNWHKEFDELWLENSKVSQIYTLMGCFWPKYIMFELKSTEELYFMTLECDGKFEENWLAVRKMPWGICQIFTRAHKIFKIETFIGSFYSK